jgi:hypothetical protein
LVRIEYLASMAGNLFVLGAAAGTDYDKDRMGDAASTGITKIQQASNHLAS